MDIPVDPVSAIGGAPAADVAPSPSDPISLIAQGTISAASVPAGLDDPIVDQVANGFVDAAESGAIDYFDSAAGDTVLFNPSKVSREALQKADEAGKLYEVAPPITELAGTAASAPADAAGLDIPVSASQPLSKPSAAAISQRGQSMVPVTPSRRPIPGAGELQNGVARRPV